MSAELVENVYLRCDAPADWSHDGRCTVTHGRGDNWPATADALEVLARRAREEGWTVELRNEGLKGTSADCHCPDHTPEGTQPS